MTTTRDDQLRAQLMARRDEVRGELDRLDQEMRWLGADQEDERGGLGNHLAEDGSNVTEQERILAVRGGLDEVLAQVDEALGRMDRGEFGTCQRCGKPVGAERLEAFPYVRYCIECQALVEREQSLRVGGHV